MKAVNSEVTIWGQDLKLKLTTQLCFSTPDVVSKTLFYGNKVILRGSWASLIAQVVKKPPAMQETLVRFLGWEDLLEKA